MTYPVSGRSELQNLRICSHETGHAFAARILGNSVWSVTVVPGGGYEGRCVRSGPKTAHVFNHVNQTQEIVDVCAMLETIAPEIGTPRIDDAHVIVIGQSSIIELVAGVVAERVLHPDMDDLGTLHDYTEATAFGKVCCAGGSAAVEALVRYCESEAEALIRQNLEIVLAIRAALVEAGTLSGDEVDVIIFDCVAARSVEKERQRRIEWAMREANAAAFKPMLDWQCESLFDGDVRFGQIIGLR
jgi:hypothetical protein